MAPKSPSPIRPRASWCVNSVACSFGQGSETPDYKTVSKSYSGCIFYQGRTQLRIVGLEIVLDGILVPSREINA